jgi:hypothetical protein
MCEDKRTKEDEDIEYARRHYPNVRVRKATEEEKALIGQHRVYIGPPPVAKMPEEREEDEE